MGGSLAVAVGVVVAVAMSVAVAVSLTIERFRGLPHTWVNLGFTLTTRYSKCVKGYLCSLPRSPRIWLWVKKE